MRVLDAPRLVRLPSARTAQARVGAAPLAWRWLLWRCLPWTAPTLCLAPQFRPRDRFELVLCETFRCQPRLSAAALVERLAPARAGSSLDGALPGALTAGPLSPDDAWALVRRWLAEERVILERG
jgi:hypothetical protein